MKKLIVINIHFFILTSVLSIGQGIWIEEVLDLNTGLRTGSIEIHGKIYELKPNADLTGANLEGANLEKVNLTGAILREANLNGAILKSANLRASYLLRANLRGTVLTEANLSIANLRETNLIQAYSYQTDFEEANLRFADLSNANLEGAELAGANLEGADLSGANIEGSDFEGANFSVTTDQIEAINANTAKIGITTEQSSAIEANTAKISELTTHSSAQFQTLGDNHKAIEERINLLGQNDLTLIRLIDKSDDSILGEINAINNEMETLKANDTKNAATIGTISPKITRNTSEIAELKPIVEA